MNSRLDTVTDWEALARKAEHKAARLAGLTGVSRRHLERYFQLRWDCCPHQLLVRTRLFHAVELLCQGLPNKAVALAVGFQTDRALSRFLHEHTGFPPSKLLRDPSAIEDVLRMSGWPSNCGPHGEDPPKSCGCRV